MMSAKYRSVFLNTTMPTTSMMIMAVAEMPSKNQFIGSVAKIAPRAALIMPVKGLSAKIHEYAPASEGGYITGVTNRAIWLKYGRTQRTSRYLTFIAARKSPPPSAAQKE